MSLIRDMEKVEGRGSLGDALQFLGLTTAANILVLEVIGRPIRSDRRPLRQRLGLSLGIGLAVTAAALVFG